MIGQYFTLKTVSIFEPAFCIYSLCFDAENGYAYDPNRQTSQFEIWWLFELCKPLNMTLQQAYHIKK